VRRASVSVRELPGLAAPDRDGGRELLVSFVLTGHEELQAIVDECEAAGLGA